MTIQFQCYECGCVETAANGNYTTNKNPEYMPKENLGQLLCRSCMFIKVNGKFVRRNQWTGKDKRVYLPKNQYRTTMAGRLVDIESDLEPCKSLYSDTEYGEVVCLSQASMKKK